MRPGRLARRSLEAVEAYRASPRTAFAHQHCRCTPTCSRYAENALRTQAFPVAVLAIVLRIASCNPLMRPRRTTFSRRNVGRAFALLGLTGFVVLGTAAAADALRTDKVNGGCTATINGNDVADLTKGNPLVVNKGQEVRVRGTVPPAYRNTQSPFAAGYTIAVVDGIYNYDTDTGTYHGPEWTRTLNVDNYLKYGTGLYRVTASAYSASPRWDCDAVAYVHLKDGNPLTKPIGLAATGLAAVGAVGAVAAAQTGKPTADEVGKKWGEDVNRIVDAPPKEEPPEPPAPPAKDPFVFEGRQITSDGTTNAGFSLGCAVFIILVLLTMLAFSSSSLAAGLAAVAATGRGRIRRRGHVIVGFVSGVLLGLGLAVLVQQFGHWILSIQTVIVFPLVVGVLCAARAWIGKFYKIA